MKVNGPYFNKGTGSYRVSIVDDEGNTTTKYYDRYLIEQHLGRTLADNESVTHINGDKTDNRIENLQVVTHSDESGHLRPGRIKKWYDFTCPVCGKEAQKEYWKYRRDQLIRGYDGPYCSSSCKGKASWQKRRL